MRKPEIMTNDEAMALAMKIAKLIQKNNPEWTAKANETDGPYVFLHHKDGATAMIQWPLYPTKGAKFEGDFTVRRQADYSKGPRLSIGVSMERSPEEIAKAFERRLLPGVLEKWKAHQEGKKKDDDYKADHRAAMVRLANAAGAEAPEGQRTTFTFVRLADKDFSAEVDVHSPTSAQIDFRYLPIDIAEKILTLIKGAI